VSGPNVGYATLSIIPSARGFEKALKAQTLPSMSAAGRTAGEATSKSFLSSFSADTLSGLDRFGGQVTKWAKRGLLAGMAAAGATVSAGLWGGLKRALDREDAIVSFRRMGLDQSNIDQLTNAIDTALSGTPITNPEGFALAGRFLAQGFEQANIPAFISTIADMSKVGNRSFQEMADVMIAAAGAGKITAAELNRMGDLPLGRVAEALGMTESKMREMASAGGLTAESFLDAFGSITEFNNAAKDATTRVAFSNLKTAISALGENFVGPLLGENGPAQRGLLAIRERVAALSPTIKTAGEGFAAWLIPAVQSAARWFESTLVPAITNVVDHGRRLVGWIRDNRDQITKLAKAAVPAVGAVAALATSVHLGIKAFKILKTASPVGLLIAIGTGLVYAYQNSEKFRDVVDKALGWVTTNVLPALARAAEWVVTTFRQHWPQIQAAIEQVVTWLQTVAWPIAQQVFQWIAGEVRALVAYVQDYWPKVQETIAGVIEAVKIIIETTVAVIQAIWEKWGDRITEVVASRWATIKTVIQSVMDIVRGVINTVTSLIRGDWEGVWEGIKTVFSGVWEAIKAVAADAMVLLRNGLAIGWDLIKAGASAAWDGIKSKASEVWDSIKSTASSAIDEVVGFVEGLPGRLLDFLEDLVSAGADIGSSILKGIVDGIANAADYVGDLAGNIAKAAKEAARTAINWVIDKVNRGLEFTIPIPDLKVMGKGISIPDITINPPDIPSIPSFHTGGWVPGRPGQEVFALLQAGEYVVNQRAAQQMLLDTRASQAIANGGRRGDNGRNAPLISVAEQHIHSDVDVDAMWQRANAFAALA